MIGKFFIPIANRCFHRKWSSSRPTFVPVRRARQFVAFFSSWVSFFTGWYFYVLEMSSRKNVLVVPHFVLYLQPSAASGHHSGQQGLLCGLGGERGGCFSKKITCVSHLTLFLQVLPIKSSAALWPVAILEYFVLIECPLSPKSPL